MIEKDSAMSMRQKHSIAANELTRRLYNIDGEDFFNKYGHKCPIGVNGRNSDNSLYFEKVGWKVSEPLINGMQKTFSWINQQLSLIHISAPTRRTPIS